MVDTVNQNFYYGYIRCGTDWKTCNIESYAWYATRKAGKPETNGEKKGVLSILFAVVAVQSASCVVNDKSACRRT